MQNTEAISKTNCSVEHFHMDRLTELVLQERVSCGCVYHNPDRVEPLGLFRRWSIFGLCNGYIIYVKSNSEAVCKKNIDFHQKFAKIEDFKVDHSKKNY